MRESPAAARASQPRHERKAEGAITSKRTSKAAPNGASENTVKGGPSRSAKPALDHSGRRRVGHASYYADRFAGQKMADGTPMAHHDDNAASRTLPLGTQARVTNLKTGKSAVVTIQDRGPYAKGRIIDLSKSTATRIGLGRKDGVAKVEVAPIAVPMPDGSTKRVEPAGQPPAARGS